MDKYHWYTAIGTLLIAVTLVTCTYAVALVTGTGYMTVAVILNQIFFTLWIARELVVGMWLVTGNKSPNRERIESIEERLIRLRADIFDETRP